MRRLMCLMVWIGAACGPTSGNGDAGDDPRGDGGGPVEEPDAHPPCEAVCFRWAPEPPPPPPPPPGQPVDIEYDECNQYGLRPGDCPDGFDCGPSETFATDYMTLHTPVCSPVGSAPHVIDVDLARAPVAPDAIDVFLTLTLNQGPWPDGSADLPRAGTFRAISQTDPQLSWTFDVPAEGQTLAMKLPPDVYDVQVTLDDWQGLHYPGGFGRGVLEVIESGTGVLPFEAAIATMQVSLDGVAVPTLQPGHSVYVQLERVQGGFAYRSFTEGRIPTATIVLKPGDYRRAMSTYSPDESTFPTGFVKLDGMISLEAGGSMSLPIDATTILTSGNVTVDGVDLPPSSWSGTVIFAQESTQSRADVSSTRPASFSKRLYPGTYDVIYDSRGASLGSTVPSGVALARNDWTAAATSSIAVDTVLVSGSVTLNGVSLASNAGGWVDYAGPHGTTGIALGSGAGGSYSGRIFEGTYDVTIRGDGTPLPNLDVPVRAQWTATTAAQTWQLAAHTLTVTVTHNGQIPLAAADSWTRGYVYVQTEILGRELSTSLDVPASGSMQASAVLPDGDWTISYGHWSTDYMGTPLGLFGLGETQMNGTSRNVTYDLRSVWVSGEVMIAGAQLPSVTVAEDRGSLGFMGGGYGNGGSGWLPPFDLTGPADYGMWIVPGVYDVSYYCSTDGCRARGLPYWASVYQAIRID